MPVDPEEVIDYASKIAASTSAPRPMHVQTPVPQRSVRPYPDESMMRSGALYRAAGGMPVPEAAAQPPSPSSASVAEAPQETPSLPPPPPPQPPAAEQAVAQPTEEDAPSTNFSQGSSANTDTPTASDRTSLATFSSLRDELGLPAGAAAGEADVASGDESEELDLDL